MAQRTSPLLPHTREMLAAFGERLKLARKRRKLTAKQVAERAGMTPMTLRSLEAGGAGVTIGAYLAVMKVLGLEQDLNLLAADDTLGHQLQDARLTSSTKLLPVKSAYKAKETYAAHQDQPLVEGVNEPEPEQNKTQVVTSADLASLLNSGMKK
ncbi:hypothetical protein AC790_23545 [Pantoea sp. RIT-PI-b]|uniref:helix-turn-helix domain-containing protein n=1 Tax=Pantoea sp. RIT-PI-b TaxID=1681195 RepID=UPI00067674AC|nr:helix-turn-helix transcriptional regulator [Pantoea sp. RIT-PI-b]KNC05979.1 hypothetical protein AC790_23545 [Pantoea sp. RIT-PI-b]